MITDDSLNRRFKLVLTIEFIVALIMLYIMFIYKPNYYDKFQNTKFNVQNSIITSNTTRIDGKDFYEVAAAISQINYPSTFHENRPNGIILVRGDRKEDAILSSRLMHDPINAPMLYIDRDNIPKTTLDEMKRLNPKGIHIDRNKNVILIGDVDNTVKDQLNKSNFNFRHISGKDVFELGKNIDDYCATLNGNHKDVVMTVPLDMSDYALAETAWCAYSGDPILFIKRDEVPEETYKSLQLRHGGSYIYMIGNEKLVSSKVKDELLKEGHLQSIPLGYNPYSQSTGFASFRDIGKNSAWWIHKKPRYFGWGISESGHNFIFVNPDQWQNAVAASGLSYKAKYGPMILIEKNRLPEDTIKYLQVVKPMKISPKGQIYNHGWIVGSLKEIDPSVQWQLNKWLEYGEG